MFWLTTLASLVSQANLVPQRKYPHLLLSSQANELGILEGKILFVFPNNVTNVDAAYIRV